jgi:hypothetical protein
VEPDSSRSDFELPRNVEFAFEQMFRGLDRNIAVLSDLRQRTSVVLSATGIVASLLGPQALTGHYSHALALLALGSTAAGMLACIAVFWQIRDVGRLPTESEDGELIGGTREWLVTITARRLRQIARGEDDPLALLDRLAVARRVNWRTLRRRTRYFVLACCLLLAQLAMWAALYFERTW